MKKPGYYSSGEFARMAGVTLRTIRYYDKQNILKPSLVSEAGARFYTEEDFAAFADSVNQGENYDGEYVNLHADLDYAKLPELFLWKQEITGYEAAMR